MDFDGKTFEQAHDGPRLTRQLLKVATLMGDHAWRTLAEIATEAGCSEASASARLRDLRKSKFGGFTVERQRRGRADKGLFEYRVMPPPKVAEPQGEMFREAT